MNKRYNGHIDENTPLLVLAGPMFFETLLNILVHNVDTIMLSHYSENAVGAVGNANQILNLFVLMFGIISTATSVVVAQYLGAKEEQTAMNRIYTLVVMVNLVFGLILSGLLVIFGRLMMTAIHVSAEMMPYSMTYIRIVGGMLFLQAVYNVMLQILRCNGHTKVGMYISVMINLINIVGNYIFLYGPLKFLNFGVKGVALATVTARIVAVSVAVFMFYRYSLGKFSLKLLNPFPGKLLSKMIKIGLPSAGESLSYNMYQIVLLSFINSLGNGSVNARAYCNTLISLANVFSNQCALATQIITGHLVGAGKEDAAYRRVWRTLLTSMPITLALAAVNWQLSPYTLRLFTDNQAIIDIAYKIMFVDLFIEVGRVLNMTFVCSLKASGDYVFPLAVGLFTMWFLGATGGHLFGITLGLGAMGVFMGTAIDECVRGIIVMGRWKSGKWRGKSIVEKRA
ncbi:MAG: MATE family efflux transporter [Acetatifactor sp.]|nr:MATE family efflux transporter [Acetatifactor sp.]